MPRENSFSDSEGHSTTPGPEDEPISSPFDDGSAPTDRLLDVRSRSNTNHVKHSPPPIAEEKRTRDLENHGPTSAPTSPTEPASARRPSLVDPKVRFRSAVQKVITIRQSRIGEAEPGVDPRRPFASHNYDHIHQLCAIEVTDYSRTSTSFKHMTNAEFIRFLSDDNASARQPWVRVRWINIGGISWDVISALALKYGACQSS